MPDVGELQQLDQGSLGEEGAVPSGAGGADADLGGTSYEIDGENFTQEQIREAIEAQRDKGAWEAAFKQRDMRFARVRGSIENGWGKKLSDFDDNDLRDLHALGLINSKVRSDPEFGRLLQESLVESYKKAGLTPGQARQAAREDVKAAQQGQGGQGQQTQLPPEVAERLGKVDRIESMILEQGMAQFQSTLEGEIAGVLGAGAKDLGKFHPMLRRMVLHEIAGYSDVELLEKYQSGALKSELAKHARQAAKTVRGWTSDKQTEKGQQVAAGKAGAAPGPARGGTAERVTESETKPGRGLRSYADRLLREIGGKAQ